MSAVRSEVEELKDKIAKLEVSSKVYFACWNCILELWLHFHYSGQPADVSTGEQLSPHERDPGSARDHAQLRPARPAWSTAPQLSTSSGACPPCSTATSALKLLPHLSLIWRRTISYSRCHLPGTIWSADAYKHKTRRSLGPTPVSRPRACGHKMNSYSWADSPRI